ncbi:hypothetical protein FOZ63_005944, partial [Perkinsus olseni]
ARHVGVGKCASLCVTTLNCPVVARGSCSIKVENVAGSSSTASAPYGVTEMASVRCDVYARDIRVFLRGSAIFTSSALQFGSDQAGEAIVPAAVGVPSFTTTEDRGWAAESVREEMHQAGCLHGEEIISWTYRILWKSNLVMRSA